MNWIQRCCLLFLFSFLLSWMGCTCSEKMCLLDTECPIGQSCRTGVCLSGVTVAPATCQKDSDCGSGETCDLNVCKKSVLLECAQDSDCKPANCQYTQTNDTCTQTTAQTCDPNTKKCVAGISTQVKSANCQNNQCIRDIVPECQTELDCGTRSLSCAQKGSDCEEYETTPVCSANRCKSQTKNNAVANADCIQNKCLKREVRACSQDSDCKAQSVLTCADGKNGCLQFKQREICENQKCKVLSSTQTSYSSTCQKDKGLCEPRPCTQNSHCYALSCQQKGNDCITNVTAICDQTKRHCVDVEPTNTAFLHSTCQQDGTCKVEKSSTCQKDEECKGFNPNTKTTCQQDGKDCLYTLPYQPACSSITKQCVQSQTMQRIVDANCSQSICVPNKKCKKDEDCDERTVCDNTSELCVHPYLLPEELQKPITGFYCPSNGNKKEDRCQNIVGGCLQISHSSSSFDKNKNICVPIFSSHFVNHSTCVGKYCQQAVYSSCKENSDCAPTPSSCQQVGTTCYRNLWLGATCQEKKDGTKSCGVYDPDGNEEILHAICSQQQCHVVDTDANCQTDADCNQGLAYCVSKKCAATQTCATASDCHPNSKCINKMCQAKNP